MAKGKQQDAWVFFGEALEERRKAAGLTQEELGGRVFVSGAHIGLFEQGIRKPQLDVAQRIDGVLQTGGIFERTVRKLTDNTGPGYWAILHENGVLTPVGGPAVTAAAPDHIATPARERRALVTVPPRSVGAHAYMTGTLTLMEFEDQPPTAFTETAFTGSLLDGPAVVKQAQRAYDLVRSGVEQLRTDAAVYRVDGWSLVASLKGW